MAKNIIKETIIVLLLCLAIILLLGILLYEYVPMAKTIPNPVSYTTPENVKEELTEAGGIDESQVIMTYEVDSNDLSNYKKIQDYKPGKANPFSSYETAGTNPSTGNGATGQTNSSAGSTNTQNGSSQGPSTTEENTTSGGQFFQNKGTK